MLTIDGSQGEGGGQIVRTALAFSAITGTPVAITDIRAGRKPRGLRPQHVAAIQAAAEICDATIEGVAVGSHAIAFEPGGRVQAGQYSWAVGTAGSATLVLQTVLLPLALANGDSTVSIQGGTHVPFSPSGHYLRDVYIPLLLQLGAQVDVEMESYGWMPEGGGLLIAQVRGRSKLQAQNLRERGEIERIFGTAVGCNLPSHIPQRIANRALSLLESIDATLDIRPLRARGISTGAGLFLAVEYTNGRAGFDTLGERGMPSEVVAEKTVTTLLGFHASDAAVDKHLADQLIVPLAVTPGESVLSTSAITPHLETNIAVTRAFVDRPITVDEDARTVTFGS